MSSAATARLTEKILVIEDDRAIQRALKRLFESEDYGVHLSEDGNAGLEAFRSVRPSLVVLDLRLPGVPGRDVCREIKEESPQLPVIVLSAKTDVTDKVLLLELGADDYVTKPFSPRELLARVRTAMRRTNGSAVGTAFTFGDVTVNFAKMELTRSGQYVALTPQEFKALKFFVQNAGRVIARDELLNEVWGYQNYPSTRTVDNHILRLRQKLERDPANPTYFKTVHGAGYKFVPEGTR
ncbi:MAG TPA: response regulator transcription factor [Candidatus Acidoferrales bacterium]|nr:response regulator transcription factor [Candidatus Acidoferrales bacterium]